MKIKEYLFNVMKLEISIYEQEKIINELYTRKQNIINYPGYKEHRKYEHFEKKPLSITLIGASAIIFSIISTIICMYIDLRGASPGYVLFFWWASILVGCLIGAPSGAIVGVIVSAIINKSINKKSRLEFERQNDQIHEYNKGIDEYNKKCKSIANSKAVIFDKEIQMLKNSVKEAKLALTALYNLNVLYPKYRHMVAIFTFFEYFDSGRCSQLDGHEGAYNLFEEEVRFGIVFEKLDIIIDKLNSIAQGQNELKHALIESNKRIGSIVNEIGTISNSLQDISHSVKLTEYNSYRSKECAEALAWIKTYELLK